MKDRLDWTLCALAALYVVVAYFLVAPAAVQTDMSRLAFGALLTLLHAVSSAAVYGVYLAFNLSNAIPPIRARRSPLAPSTRGFLARAEEDERLRERVWEEYDRHSFY